MQFALEAALTKEKLQIDQEEVLKKQQLDMKIKGP